LISILNNLKLNREITSQAAEEIIEKSKETKKIKQEVLLSGSDPRRTSTAT
jgi:hypothetical protein